MTNAPMTEDSTAFGAARRGSLGLLRERGRGVEAVDHEEGHEHRDQERAGADVRARVSVTTSKPWWLWKASQDEREHEHAEDLEHHARCC